MTKNRSESPHPAIVWLDELLGDIDSLRVVGKPRPYRSQRNGVPLPKESNLSGVVRRVRVLIGEFEAEHFFARTLGYDCVDNNGPSDTSPENELDKRVGKRDLWAASDNDYDLDDLCDLVEVFHDLAARPTRDYYHSFSGCGTHPLAYNVASGQALYRWRINNLLDLTTIDLRLAIDGEDIGRMVSVASPGVDVLLDEVLATANSHADGQEVRHAIATFRDRQATRESRRAAIVALARVLEGYRPMMKKRLVTKDEDALFEIANRFDLRHNNAAQYRDFPDEYHDWIFYWYLATVDLCRRLSQSTGPQPKS
jgi:hypothetical protein